MEHVVCPSASPVVPDTRSSASGLAYAAIPKGPQHPAFLASSMSSMYRRIYARQAHPGQVFCLRIRGNRRELAPSPTRQKTWPNPVPKALAPAGFYFYVLQMFPPDPPVLLVASTFVSATTAGKASAAVAVQHAMRHGLCSSQDGPMRGPETGPKKKKKSACATTTPTPHEMSTV